ncbi:hypothetical protein [Rubripirellula reticaptiva]|nr:hypothetical protein [Rubripirellula reticaptiva]
MTEEDKAHIPAELPSIVVSDDRLSRRRKKRSTRIPRFVHDNWMSFALLLQAASICISFGLLLVTQSRIVFLAYALLLLVRWVNYPLAVAALFNDKTKWLAVISGVIYTLCSLSGRLLVAAN